MALCGAVPLIMIIDIMTPDIVVVVVVVSRDYLVESLAPFSLPIWGSLRRRSVVCARSLLIIIMLAVLSLCFLLAYSTGRSGVIGIVGI